MKLTADAIVKQYGRRKVVDEVGFEVRTGEPEFEGMMTLGLDHPLQSEEVGRKERVWGGVFDEWVDGGGCVGREERELGIVYPLPKEDLAHGYVGPAKPLAVVCLDDTPSAASLIRVKD